jgi:hypothetical protein
MASLNRDCTPYHLSDPSHRAGSLGTLVRIVARFFSLGYRSNDICLDTRDDPWLARYKEILASILPAEFLGDDGLLQAPADSRLATHRPEYIQIIPPRRTRWQKNSRYDAGQFGASYRGGLPHKLLRRNLLRAETILPTEEMHTLREYVVREIEALPSTDTIDLTNLKRPGSLAHEAFHDIQGHLLDYRPDVFERLHEVVANSRQRFEQWYTDPETVAWRSNSDYQFHHIFPTKTADVPYSDEFLQKAMSYHKRASQRRLMSQEFWDNVYPETMKDLGRVEAIPVLLAASAERNVHATEILSSIFGEAGLRSDFHQTMPRC